MNAVVPIVTLSLLAGALVGCSAGGRRDGERSGADPLRADLQPLLASGTVEVLGYSATEVDKLALRASYLPGPGGGAVARLSGVASRRTSAPSGSALFLPAGGGVVLLDPSLELGAPLAATPVAPRIAAGGVLLGGDRIDLGTRYVRSNAGLPIGGTVGTGASPEYVAVVSATGGVVLGSAFPIEGPHRGRARALFSRPAAQGLHTRWVEEIAPGVLAVVLQSDDGTLTWARSDGEADRTLAGMPIPLGIYGAGEPDLPVPARFSRETSGHLLLAVDDPAAGPGGRIVRWRVGTDGGTEEVALATPIDGVTWREPTAFGESVGTRLEPNPAEPSLGVPIAASWRRFDGASFVVSDVPTTPCVDAERCRSQGESTLLGVVGEPAHPVAVYALWSWRRTLREPAVNLVAVLARPLDPAAPVVPACREGATSCASESELAQCVGGTTLTTPCTHGPQCLLGSCGAACVTDADCHQAKSSCERDVCQAGGCALAYQTPSTLCAAPQGVGVCDAAGQCQSIACGPGCSVSLDVGALTGCVVKGDGHAVCWGPGLPGPVGGSEVYLSSTGQTAEVGGSLSCVVETNGKVTCAGTNDHGQLANGTTKPALGWVPLGLDAPKALSLGASHGCAIRPGDVACWGANADAQVGNGAMGGDVTAALSVAKGDFSAIAAGAATSCAIAAGGGLWCWGNNASGEAATGSVGGHVMTPTATAVTGAVAVALGDHHGCAVTTGAGLLCWGAGARGQAGPAGTTASGVAAAVPLTGVVRVSAGAEHTCALLSDGTVTCFGANDRGQLGLGTTDDVPHPVPATVPGLAHVTSIAAAGRHTCALLDPGVVACWGENDQRQLGDGTTSDRPAPVIVTH